MRELKVHLEFACCQCGHNVEVTLQCAGKGLLAGPHTLASVRVRCPTCQDINQLSFTPSGTVRQVLPDPRALAIPEPSFN